MLNLCDRKLPVFRDCAPTINLFNYAQGNDENLSSFYIFEGLAAYIYWRTLIRFAMRICPFSSTPAALSLFYFRHYVTSARVMTKLGANAPSNRAATVLFCTTWSQPFIRLNRYPCFVVYGCQIFPVTLRFISTTLLAFFIVVHPISRLPLIHQCHSTSLLMSP